LKEATFILKVNNNKGVKKCGLKEKVDKEWNIKRKIMK
jgi:hypothetical protein